MIKVRTIKQISYILILFLFFFSTVSCFRDQDSDDSSMKEFMQSMILITGNAVKERDKKIVYKPFPPRKGSCKKSIIQMQDIPYDGRGAYPVLTKDIHISCRAENDKIIIAMGDSITEGPGIPSALTFPGLLSNIKPSVIFINAGIGGAGTEHWSYDGILFQKTFVQNKDQIDAVLFLLGGNDILYQKSVLQKKPDMEALTARLSAILLSIEKTLPNAKIYLANYPTEKGTGHAAHAALEAFRKSPPGNIKTGPDLSAGFENPAPYLMIDGLHLNEKGHARLAKLWEEFLRKEGLFD